MKKLLALLLATIILPGLVHASVIEQSDIRTVKIATAQTATGSTNTRYVRNNAADTHLFLFDGTASAAITSADISVQASPDGSTFFTTDTATLTFTSGLATLRVGNLPTNYIRLNITGLSATTPNITVWHSVSPYSKE